MGSAPVGRRLRECHRQVGKSCCVFRVPCRDLACRAMLCAWNVPAGVGSVFGTHVLLLLLPRPVAPLVSRAFFFNYINVFSAFMFYIVVNHFVICLFILSAAMRFRVAAIVSGFTLLVSHMAGLKSTIFIFLSFFSQATPDQSLHGHPNTHGSTWCPQAPSSLRFANHNARSPLLDHGLRQATGE